MNQNNSKINLTNKKDKLFSIKSPFRKLLLLSVLLFIIKLLLLPYVHAVDADGVSRIYISQSWLENPEWIKSGNWGPIYFYLMGSALMVYNNPFYTPLIVNIVFSIATLFPLYFLFKRIYNESTALILCFLFSLSPIIFRLSLLALAETPYLFFVSLSVYLVYKGLKEEKISYVFFGGIMSSIAGGFRYESWILSTLLALLILIKYSKKNFFVFSITAFAFPCIWLISNYMASDNFLNSFNWVVDATVTNKVDSLESLLRRIWFYPLSLIFAFGPIAFFYLIKAIKTAYKDSTSRKVIITYGIIFFIVLIIFLFNTIRGSLLLQHRFTITLYLLSLPLLGYYFTELSRKKINLVFLFAFTGFALSYAYSSKGTRPIPRLLNKDAIEINNIVRLNSNKNSGLILDFWNWENTFCIAFMSDISRSNVTFLDQNNDLNKILVESKRIITNYHEGYILICNKSRFNNELEIQNDTLFINKENMCIQVKQIKKFNEGTLYKYNNNSK